MDRSTVAAAAVFQRMEILSESNGMLSSRPPSERSVDDERKLLRLCLCHSTALRPKDRIALDERLSRVEDLRGASVQDASSIIGRPLRASSWQPERWLRAAEGDAAALAHGRLSCTWKDESDFPALLASSSDPPLLLFYRGTLPTWQQGFVAVVGTRQPTGSGRTAAFLMGYELAVFGLAVVSGLARGVDRLAHEGALRAGGLAVAVLGNGIDRVFPGSSAPLGRSILGSGGCLLSEYPPGVPASRHNFPARNRIVSGLCRALVIVQAPQRSGALISAEYALDEGRDLFVHAAGIDGPQSGGTRDLAESGARVVARGRDLLAEWGCVLPPERDTAALDLASAMEAELAGGGGEFNGVFYDATGRPVDG